MSQYDPTRPAGDDRPWTPNAGSTPPPGAWQPGGYGPGNAGPAHPAGATPGSSGSAPGYPGSAPGYPGPGQGYPGSAQDHPGSAQGFPGFAQGFAGSAPGHPGSAPGQPGGPADPVWAAAAPTGWAGPTTGPAKRPDHRPAAFNVSAALSFVTASVMAATGMFLLTSLITYAAVRSSGFRSGSSGTTEAILLMIVALGTGFLLFWGGLDLAQARSAVAALIGNGIAVLLAVIVAVSSTGFALLFAVVPALAIWTAILARNWMARSSG